MKNTMPITGGVNGYPEPEIGTAIFPEDKAELKEMFKSGEGLTLFSWKNGWTYCQESPRKAYDLDDIKDFFYDATRIKEGFLYERVNWDAEAFKKFHSEDIESDDPDSENELMNIKEWVNEIIDHFEDSDICLFRPYDETLSWKYEDGFVYDGEHNRFGLKKGGV